MKYQLATFPDVVQELDERRRRFSDGRDPGIVLLDKIVLQVIGQHGDAHHLRPRPVISIGGEKMFTHDAAENVVEVLWPELAPSATAIPQHSRNWADLAFALESQPSMEDT